MDKIAAEAAKEICIRMLRDITRAFGDAVDVPQVIPGKSMEEYAVIIERALSQSLAARDKEIEKAIKELRRQAIISNYGCCSRAMDARADELETALLKGKAI